MIAEATPSSALREVFIGRQPILDKDHGLAGYELLFRAAAQDASINDARGATAEVVCNAFAQLGFSNLLGTVRAFVNVDAAFLAEDLIEALPKEIMVFEIGVDVITDAAAVERCRQLKALGYQFALSGLTQVDAAVRAVLDLAGYFKVDVNVDPPERLQDIARELRTARRPLVACRVETQAQMGLCALLGFELFQGFYFAKPDVIEGRSLDASTQSLFRLLKLLSEDAEADQLEKAFRTEPALVVNLLRLTNSVGVGARVRISSVRHAIAVLGRRQLQRWLQLLLFSRGSKIDLKHNPLMEYAALRGRFMELLVDRLHRDRRELRDPAFITGLMSVMPAALGMTMTDILTHISVDNDVRLALARREGALGQLLAIIDAYDDNDIPTLQEQLARHGGSVHFGLLVEILTEALQWVQQLEVDNG